MKSGIHYFLPLLFTFVTMCVASPYPEFPSSTPYERSEEFGTIQFPSQQSEKQTTTCTMNTDTVGPVKILQENGEAETLLRVDVCPTDGSTLRLEYRSSSSSTEVLPDSDISLQIISSARCQNVTVVLAFDSMVGQTVYTLSAVDTTETSLCSLGMRFIIAGFTVYQQISSVAQRVTPSVYRKRVLSDADPSKTNVILSGDANRMSEDYQQVVGGNPRFYAVRVQYLDGSDSNTRSSLYVASSMSSITMASPTNLFLPVQPNDPSCASVESNPDATLLPSGCHVAFTIQETVGFESDVLLAIKYHEYRAGQVRFVFRWDALADSDPDLRGEPYQNFLTIEVTGSVPPIVLDIEPKGKEFYRAGGESISLVLHNTAGSSQRDIVVGDTVFPEIPGTYRRMSNGLFVADYLTQPGSGSLLTWFLEATLRNGEVRQSPLLEKAQSERFSYITTPFSIDDVSPEFADPGQIVTVTGYFDAIDLSRPAHDVILGNKPLSELGFKPNVSEYEITFILPPREMVGSSYIFPIIVVMNTEKALTEKFSYVPEIPLAVEIEVYGASYVNETEVYTLGNCDISDYHASLPSGISYPDDFQWVVFQQFDLNRENLLTAFPDIPARNSTMRLFPKVFGGRTGSFVAFVSCSVHGEQLNTTVSLLKTTAPIIGLTLSRQQARSVSLPDVPVRFSSLVVPPPSICYSGTFEIIYEWTFDEKTYEFSYLNNSISIESGPTPTRFGREFIIPQTHLDYGNHSISVLAYMKDTPSIRGTSITSFEIIPPDMIPIIGYGSSMIVQSAVQDMQISGERSYNPDGVRTGETSVDSFKWNCSVSVFGDPFAESYPCGSTFLPPEVNLSISVPSIQIQSFRDTLQSSGRAGGFSLRYSLQVGTSTSLSDPSYLNIDIHPYNIPIASLTDVDVYDNKGNSLDWLNVRAFEDIVISPKGDDVSWDFQIIAPPSSVNIFNDSRNFMHVPGYYDPSTSNPWQRKPLGIRAGALRTAQEYEIAILIKSNDETALQGETRIIIRTQDSPRLILPVLPVVKGDTNTVFTASAKVNLDFDEFLYYFFLVDEGREHYCLDGCSGRTTIQFRIIESGTFALLVRLRDIQGTSLLDESFFSESIFVSAVETADEVNFLQVRMLLNEVRRTGDHGTFQLLASTTAKRASGQDDIDAETLSLAVDTMHQVVSNAAPSTMEAKSYIATAVHFAKIDDPIFATEETIYTLFSWVDKAITQVPLTQSLDLETELRSFYNCSAKLVLGVFLGSSSAIRLARFGEGSGLDSRSLLVDMYLLLRKHFAIAISRNAECGAIRHVNTVVDDGIIAADVAELMYSVRRKAQLLPRHTYDFIDGYQSSASPLFAAFTIGVLCSPEQGIGIKGDLSEFRWCDDLLLGLDFSTVGGEYYINPNQKRLFMLLETPDYVSLTGLAGDGIETDTEFLVSTSIATLSSTGLQTIAYPEIRNCLSISTKMKRLGLTANKGCLSADAFRVEELGRLFTPRTTESHLKRDFSVAEADLSHDGSSDVSISSSTTGVYGAVGRDCPVNLRKPIIEIPENDIEFAYLVFGGVVVSVVGVTVTWVSSSGSYVGFVGAAAAV